MRSLLLVLGLLLASGVAGCADRQDEPTTSASTTLDAEPSDDVEPSEPDPTVNPAQVKAAAKALRGYLRAADAGNCAAVKKRVLLPEQVECADVHDMEGQWSAGGDDLTRVKISADVIDDSGFATVTWADGSDDTWDLQEVDGRWVVLNVDSTDDA